MAKKKGLNHSSPCGRKIQQVITRRDPAWFKVHIHHWTDSWNVDSDIEDKDNNKDEEKDDNKKKVE